MDAQLSARAVEHCQCLYKEKNGDVVEQAQMVESAIAQSESFAGTQREGLGSQ